MELSPSLPWIEGTRGSRERARVRDGGITPTCPFSGASTQIVVSSRSMTVPVPRPPPQHIVTNP